MNLDGVAVDRETRSKGLWTTQHSIVGVFDAIVRTFHPIFGAPDPISGVFDLVVSASRPLFGAFDLLFVIMSPSDPRCRPRC